MPPVSKFKSNDGILSMYLVPKKMFNTLLSILDDEENRNEIIALNQSQTSNNNYIENAIAFRNRHNEKKKNTPSSNLQKPDITEKPDITDNQSFVTPSTLSKTISTFRGLQPSGQSDTLPTNVSGDITLPDNQTTDQVRKSGKKSVTTSTPVRQAYKNVSFRNSPV